MPFLKRRTLLALGLSLGLAASAGVHAASDAPYPTQTIRLLVGYSPGGSVDIVARLFAQRLGILLKQSVVVENRDGASGTIAAQAVARAAPDGYTLYFAASPTITITPAVQHTLFDPVKSFQPIAPIASYTNVLLVNAKSPYADLRALVADAKKRPGALTFGSAGVGSSNHLSGELLAQNANVQLTHVPYKGNAPAMTDLIAGRITMLFDLNTTAVSLVDSGQVRALAVTSGTRNPMLPNVPTMKEMGYPNFEFNGWMGLLGPTGMPAKAVEVLANATHAILAEPEFQKQMSISGYTIMQSTPAEFGALIARESATLKEVATRAHLRQP